jgi:hypothetical protein
VGRAIAGISVFVVLSLASVAVLNEASGGTIWIALLPQAVACLLAGSLLGEQIWIALALAFTPTVLAGPFGNPEDNFAEGPPIAVVELVLLPVYFALILTGWAARRAIERRRSRDQVTDV